MDQIPLPFAQAGEVGHLVVGNANRQVVEALTYPENWPFRTAILLGPPRSGKSLLARHFVAAGLGEAIDDAPELPEDALFHRWNRAQSDGRALLLVGGEGGWQITLPDLASRLGAALVLEIGTPDEEMLGELIHAHAEARRLMLDEASVAWTVPRIERSHAAAEAVVATADRISLARKAPVTQSLLRDALAEIGGEWQPNLL